MDKMGNNISKSDESLVLKTTCEIEWRTWSKYAAYLDLAIVALSLPTGIICIFQGAKVPVGMDPDTELSPQDLTQANLERMSTAFAIMGIVFLSGMGVWAAVKLINATENGRDPKDSLSMARIWRNVNFAILTFAALGMLLRQTSLACGLSLVFHALLLFVVTQYISELEKTVAADLVLENTKDQPLNEQNENGNNDENKEGEVAEKPELVVVVDDGQTKINGDEV